MSANRLWARADVIQLARTTLTYCTCFTTSTELDVGKIIGRGGFCVVKEITRIKSLDNNDSFSSFRGLGLSERSIKKKSSIFSRMRSSSSLSERSALKNSNRSEAPLDDCSTSTPSHITKEFLVKTSRSSKPRYVMKSVSDELKNQSKETYLKGCIDLALETKYLSSLSHPNILDVRGVSSCGPNETGYFIIIDRLVRPGKRRVHSAFLYSNFNISRLLQPETLPKRLNRWMTTDRQTKGVTGLFTGGKSKVDDLLADRLVVAYDIASALGYLHELHVVYRDLVR